MEEGRLALIDLTFITQEWEVIKSPDSGLSEAARAIVSSLRIHASNGNRSALETCVERLLLASGKLDTIFVEGQLMVEAAIALCKIENYQRAAEILVYAANQTQDDGPRHGFVKLLQGFVSIELGKIENAVSQLGASWRELKIWSECHLDLDESKRQHLLSLVEKIPSLQAEIITGVGS